MKKGTLTFTPPYFHTPLILSALTTFLVLTAPVEAGDPLTTEEITQINNAFGITMTPAEKTTLAGLVKPTTPLPQWRTDAEARIEQHRKANFTVEVTDTSGNSIPNAQVQFALTKKQFRFGGIMDLKEFAEGSANSDISVDTATYKSLFQELFDYAGLNNGLKPKLRGGNEALLPAYFTWLDSIGMTSRGHLIMWPGGTHMTTTVTAIVEDIENGNTDPQRKIDLQNQINSEIIEWAGLWNVTEWDVINEVLGNKRIQDILGDSEMINWFTLTKNNAANPNCRFLINEFQLISGKSTSLSDTYYIDRRDRYKTQIQQLIDGKAPLNSIGFQSRLNREHLPPETIYERMEDFAEYGFPMVGTEFEVKDRTENGTFLPSEELRAQMTEEIMTSYFSHPLMDGLYGWEYMSNTITSALLNGDGTPKMNGLVWYYLNRIRYDSKATGTTDINGQTTFRGFKGSYVVTATVDGATYPATVTMNADGTYRATTTYDDSLVVSTNTTTASEDAHVRESKPMQNVNWQRMGIKNATDAQQIIFLKFNVSGIIGTPTNTRLLLSSETQDGIVEAYTVADNSWQESTLVWNNRPDIGDKIGEAIATASGSFIIDLSNHITSDGTYTIALKSTSSTLGKIFSSEYPDDSKRPQLLVTLDSDSDGLHDGWEITYSGDTTTMDATSDTDNDGQSDLDEQKAGTAPTDRTDVFKVKSITTITADQHEITWTSKPDVSYQVMKSTTLETGSWTAASAVITATEQNTSFTLPLTGTREFYRVVIE